MNLYGEWRFVSETNRWTDGQAKGQNIQGAMLLKKQS